MAEVISVRFKEVGKNYYFDPQNKQYKNGDKVIVETARGLEFGEVSIGNREIPDEEISAPLKSVIRSATPKDFAVVKENKEREKEAFDICHKKIIEHGLVMKLVDVEYTFDRSKILFYFTADGRVDFRELVKDLAGVFHTRIELRQIGVRDESKKVGGLGICGRPFCCSTFLGSFQPVSIKMAKEQSLFLSTTKISGTCGRLMCCLKYEQDAYEYLNSFTPNVGATVKTDDGLAVVTDVNLITGNLFVKLLDSDTIPFKIHRDSVKLVSRSKKHRKEAKNGEQDDAE